MHNVAPLQLAVVVPTFKEIENVREVIARLERVLEGLRWEVIFVDDDSPDGTAEAVFEISRCDPRVRCIRRIGRRGLSSACVEGMLATSAPAIGVMDADLQHDETLLPRMYAALHDEGYQLAIGSRYVEGGSVGTWEKSRVAKSKLATLLSRFSIKADVKDPMSGFFMIDRAALYAAVRHLSGIGFKLLLDILASSPKPLRFKEIEYHFRERQAGESKLDTAVAFELLVQIADKTFGKYIPTRLVIFSIIGGFGVFLHMGVFTATMFLLNQTFIVAKAVAVIAAMTFNYLLNNYLTYRDRRRKRWVLLSGWLSFCLLCSVGALADVGISTYLFEQRDGFRAISALAGIVVGVVWNYAVTSRYTWGKR